MRRLSFCIVLALTLSAAGCGKVQPSTVIDASGECNAAECTASCQNQGYSGGYCLGTDCVCGGIDPDGTVPGTTMTGTVMSPGGLVPISGALVYFATVDPPPIPSGAYQETCEDPPGPFTLSNPDGTFSLQVQPGQYRLVVQKGQFRRIRDITVPETGPVEIQVELTTLPSQNGTGDTIPSMAILYALDAGDHIEDVLAKLGMGQVGGDHRLSLGTEHFDIYNIAPYESNTVLLNDVNRMLDYHIIFFPCTIAGFPQINDPTSPLSNQTVLDNIKAFLIAGGKIYATDMMYDIFEQPLPEYLDMCGDDNVINAADQEAWNHTETMMGWTSHGQSIEPDLSAWLDAIGLDHSNIDFMQNFVWIEDMYTEPEPDFIDPEQPKVWVTGDFVLNPSRTLPLTVTWPYGFGKVLFSTYHTVGDPGGNPGHDGIYPQEWVLVYLIMEIGVCQVPVR